MSPPPPLPLPLETVVPEEEPTPDDELVLPPEEELVLPPDDEPLLEEVDPPLDDDPLEELEEFGTGSVFGKLTYSKTHS